MRSLAFLALSATAILLPALAAADPAQPQAPASSAQMAPASTGTQATALQTPTTAPMQSATPSAAAAPAPTVTATSAGGDLNQIVCREVPAKTGSRIGGGRECHTQRYWDRMRQESQDITRHQQRTGYSGP